MNKKDAIMIALSAMSLNVVAQTDSIRTETLPEIVVNADGQIETAEKTVLLPTAMERKHSANGFDLLNVMQTAELEVSPHTKSITTHSGREVVLCINGVEVLPEDVATLRSKNVRSIEYVRTPGGKYAGKAAVVNFVTVRLAYGGNVYLSATEGLACKTGDYLAFTDFTKGGLTLSLTASADWQRDHSYTEGHEAFMFADQSVLTRDLTSEAALRKSNNEALRFRLTSVGDGHRLNAYASLTRQTTPTAMQTITAQYTGKYDGTTERLTSSDSRGLAPSLYANYTLWLPKNQTFDFTASATFGHHRYNSLYQESGQTAMTSDVTEDNNAVRGHASYYKSWKNGMTLSAALSHDHNRYTDSYAGTASGRQRLTTDVTMGVLQLSGSTQKYSYYVMAGVSNSAVSLNSTHYNYAVPVVYYGGNYALNQRHSLSLNGQFTHTLFDPSNKNAMTVPTSFFEAMKGNPDLSLIKVLTNTLAYNGQAGKSKFSVSYDNYIYFDNILHQYTADANTIYDTRINDGTFYGNILVATYTYSAFADKLRLRLTACKEYDILRGKAYSMEQDIFFARASATYLTGDWMLQCSYRTPYTTLDIRESYLQHRRPVYELLVGWNHKDWSAEASVRNPFTRYNKQRITRDFGCYHQDTWRFSEPDGRNLNLKLAYNFGYGKKQERGDTEIDKTINTAIMKTY